MNPLIRRNVQALQAYEPGEQPRQAGLIKLNTNENPYGPPPAVLDALKEIEPRRLRLYPDPNSRPLREALAAHHQCDVEQVFVGNGSDEVLSLCFRAFVEDDESVGYFRPSYSLYPVLAGIAGAETVETPLGDGFEWADPQWRPCTKLFFLTYPNAPTGIAYPRKTIRDFIQRFPGLVVIDEAYVDFAERSCIDMASRFANVLVTRSFSKSMSLAGVRVGYAIGPVDLIEALHKVKDSYNVNAVSQTLALAALESRDEIQAARTRIIQTRRETAEWLAGRGFEVLPSQANFLWVRPDWITAEKLFEHLREVGILVRYFPGQQTGSYLRISIGTDCEMEQLRGTIEEIKERT